MRHSMSEVVVACLICEEGPIKRVPSLSFTVSRPTGAGALVRDHIEQVKTEVQAEKQRLRENYDS